MQTIRFNGHYLKYYDSIDELPITNFQDYNRLALIDSGIGGGLEGVQKHIEALRRLIQADKKEEAAKELTNFHQNLIFAITKSNPELMSFVCLLKSINGELITDFSNENINRIIKQLGKKGLTIGKVRGAIQQFKKKLKASLTYFFQAFRATSKQRNFSQI